MTIAQTHHGIEMNVNHPRSICLPVRELYVSENMDEVGCASFNEEIDEF